MTASLGVVSLADRGLFFLFQFLEDVEVAKGGFLQIVVDLLHRLLGVALAAVALGACSVVAFLEGAERLKPEKTIRIQNRAPRSLLKGKEPKDPRYFKHELSRI